jgi:DNA helicase-2/ATP-dependent DNA helicase PcrA
MEGEELRLQEGETQPPGASPDSATVQPLLGERCAVGADSPKSNRLLAVRLQRCEEAIPKKSAAAWAQFTATISQLEAVDVRNSASKMIELALDAGYEDYLKENYANHLSRLDDLEQLAVFARQFQAVEDFLTQLALLTNVEAEAQDRPNRDDEQLRLSTIHQAKGLEFDVVFVIMLCEGLFPSNRSLQNIEGLEEERRLMYVAITRARNELYLSYPLVRAGFGGGDYIQQPSRFLGEIPKDLLDEWNLRLH